MRTFCVAFGLVLVLHSTANAQTPSEPEPAKVPADQSSRPPRVVRTDFELRLPKSEPRPIYHFDGDGRIRIFSNQAEADRKLQKEREEEKERSERMKFFTEQQNANAKKRAQDAEWKLGAIVLGLLVGLVRVIWGACSSRA